MTGPYLILGFLGFSVVTLLVARSLAALEKPRATLIAAALCVAFLGLLLWRPENLWVSNTGVVLGGAAAGLLLSRILGSKGSVVAFLVAAAVVDLISFWRGPTDALLRAFEAGGPSLLTYMAGILHLEESRFAVVGIGDLLILSAAYLGLRAHTGREVAPALWLLVGLLIAVGIGIPLGGMPGIPFVLLGALGYLAWGPASRT
jgi:presenilin-like A22 family membrane protease